MTSTRHKYNTRLASGSSCYIPPVRTNYGKFNTRFNGAIIWDNIDESFKRLSLLRFKRELRMPDCFILNIFSFFLASSICVLFVPFACLVFQTIVMLYIKSFSELPSSISLHSYSKQPNTLLLHYIILDPLLTNEWCFKQIVAVVLVVSSSSK